MNWAIGSIRDIKFGDWIALAALLFAICSYIPSFIALYRASPKIQVILSEFIIHEFENTSKIVLELLIINKRNIPVSIYEIGIQNKNNVLKGSWGEEQIYNIAPMSSLRIPLEFYNTQTLTMEKLRFMIKTSAKIYNVSLCPPTNETAQDKTTDRNNE